MFSLAQIQSMNRETGRKAKRHGKKPYIAQHDNDEGVSKCPNIGDYRPKGYELIDQLFVDSSGFGSSSGLALTIDQFLAKVKKGLGYAIIEQGQFQLYVGVFKKI